jgi:predicted RND superfamily exporter protein
VDAKSWPRVRCDADDPRRFNGEHLFLAVFLAVFFFAVSFAVSFAVFFLAVFPLTVFGISLFFIPMVLFCIDERL